jgi:hypothetical protein
MEQVKTSCLYDCVVMHRRLKPKRHTLKYNVFSVFIDLAELTQVARGRRLISVNRRNIFSFHEGDHGDGRATGLLTWAKEAVAKSGVELGSGRVYLFTFPRMFGYVFNPLSVYFCQDETGALRAIIYEVNNTFGQRHFYVLAAGGQPLQGVVEQSCKKTLYVSPFNGTDGEYHFKVRAPDETFSLAIEHLVDGDLVLCASQRGKRRELTDIALLRALLLYPWMTLKVVLAIHWEALKLWWKKVPLVTRPLPPTQDTTFG